MKKLIFMVFALLICRNLFAQSKIQTKQKTPNPTSKSKTKAGDVKQKLTQDKLVRDKISKGSKTKASTGKNVLKTNAGAEKKIVKIEIKPKTATIDKPKNTINKSEKTSEKIDEQKTKLKNPESVKKKNIGPAGKEYYINQYGHKTYIEE